MPDWLWIQNVVFPILGMGIAVYFGTHVFRIIHKIVDRRGAGLARAEVEELREAIEELRAEVHEEMTDLNERVDFAERALISARGASPAPPGKSPA